MNTEIYENEHWSALQWSPFHLSSIIIDFKISILKVKKRQNYKHMNQSNTNKYIYTHK